MALLGNYSVILKNPATFIGGTQVSNCRSAFDASGQNEDSFYSDDGNGLPATASGQTGTEPPYSYILPIKGGELSSTTLINGTSEMTGGASQGINIESDLAGAGELTAGLSLVTSMIAALTGSGTLTASMVGTIQMASDLAGSGDLTAAMGALTGLIVEMAGSGTLTSDLRGKLAMSADIYVNQAQASVQEIVDAVWNALASEYDLSGTMGEKLNGAGSAGDPWTTDISAYNTANTAGKILKDRLSKSQFLGLK